MCIRDSYVSVEMAVHNEPARPRSLSRGAKGASLVEYLVLVGVVALAAVVSAHSFGDAVRGQAESEGACVARLDAACAGDRRDDRDGPVTGSAGEGSDKAPEPRPTTPAAAARDALSG